MDVISRESLINKLDPLYKQKKETAPNNLAEGFMQVDGLIRREPSAFEGMTNGEVIQALFPNETMFEQTETCTYYGNMRFDTKWWNAPYQKGGE